MSLCLLVYNLGQRELRKTLKKSNSKVRNQLGELTNTPTLRWIFQCFQVVHFLRINQSPKVVNITEERNLICIRSVNWGKKRKSTGSVV